MTGLAALGVLVRSVRTMRPASGGTRRTPLAIALALSAVVLHDGPWPALLEWRPLAWIGGLGYGIYLIHEPVMRLLRRPRGAARARGPV